MRLTGVVASIALILGLASIVASGNRTGNSVKQQNREPGMSSKERNAKTILDIFGSIERRDVSRQTELFQPDIELHWPPSLPYGGITRGMKREHPGWTETWIPLQPTEAERKMDPRIVAASDDETVVLWHQRGLSAGGDRLDVEVLGLYQFLDGKLSRGQMFYFDTEAVLRFLAKAKLGHPAPGR